MDSTNRNRIPANAQEHRGVFQARLPWQDMLKLNKGSMFVITDTQFAIQSHFMKQPNCTERLHVDATIMRYFQTELFSRFLPSASSFLPSTYAGHVNMAARSLGSSCQTGNMAALLNSLFFVFKMSFLPKFRIIYYDYIVYWYSWI